MTSDEEVLYLASEIADLAEIENFMDDEYVDEALDLIVNLIKKPIPHRMVGGAIMKFSSLSSYFESKYLVYMTIKQGKAGSLENKKKNIYKGLSERCHQMAQDLKYLARDYE